jgi:hypothetical protein
MAHFAPETCFALIYAMGDKQPTSVADDQS